MRSKLLVLALLAAAANAEDLYVAQAAAGADNGTSCANAKAVSWFNTAGSWGGGAGEIDPGDTVHLCGTITGNLTIQASGTVGNPITLIYETGAKSSSAAWGTGASAAIYCSSKDYITIDGNSVGVIENTDNGTALGTQQESYGVHLSACNNATVQGLIIRDIYVRVADSDDSRSYGRGIQQANGNANLITGNTISNAKYAIFTGPTSGAQSNTTISNNVLSGSSKGIVYALGASGTSGDAVALTGNEVTFDGKWEGCWQVSTPCDTWHHNAGFHVWGRSDTDDAVTNAVVSGNYIHGPFGAVTQAGVYVEYYIPGIHIFNNVVVATTGAPTGGMLNVKGRSTVSANNSEFYNNTLVCSGSGIGILVADVTGASTKNNILTDCGSGMYLNGATETGFVSDYNTFYNLTTSPRPFRDVTGTKTWAEWQALGYDANSITSDPLLTASYALGTGSPAIGVGENLTSLSITALNSDKSGTARPASGAWDIGAYQYSPGWSKQATGGVYTGGQQ